jgi:hypothetical protein
MNINVSQLQIKPKRVGKLKEDDVFEAVTKGGLVVLATGSSNGKLKQVLGVGPHRAVARMVSQKKEPELQVTALTKSQEGDLVYAEQIAPEYAQLTERLNAELSK